MQSTEKWLPVVGYEGIYEVSDMGNVRSVDRINAKGARQLGRPKKATVGKIGYPVVCLYKDGHPKTRTIHSLVLEAFVGPRPPKHEACHNNGIRTDSRLENLRWDTSSENNLDKRAHGTDHEVNKTHCPRGHALEYPNLVPSKLKVGARQCLACTRASSVPASQKQAISDENYERIKSGIHEWSLAEKGAKCRRGHLLEEWNVYVKNGGGRECASCRRAYWHGSDRKERYEMSWKFYNEKLSDRNTSGFGSSGVK